MLDTNIVSLAHKGKSQRAIEILASKPPQTGLVVCIVTQSVRDGLKVNVNVEAVG